MSLLKPESAAGEEITKVISAARCCGKRLSQTETSRNSRFGLCGRIHRRCEMGNCRVDGSPTGSHALLELSLGVQHCRVQGGVELNLCASRIIPNREGSLEHVTLEHAHFELVAFDHENLPEAACWRIRQPLKQH